MLLNKLRPSQREKGRFRLELEDGRTLEITEEEILSFGLYSGMDLAEEQLKELARQAKRSLTRMGAARLAAARPMSRAELVARLMRKGGAKEDCEAAADRLEQLGLIDDAAYALRLVLRCADRGYGPKKMKDELFRRGIAPALWDQAMEQAPPPAEVAARYLLAAGTPLDEGLLRRAFGALCRRGFDWEEIEEGYALCRKKKWD